MMGALDSGLDFYRAVLDLRGLRQALLTADIANASTPGFKAVDLDFPAALAAASGFESSGAPAAAPLLLADDSRQFQRQGSAGALGGAVRYQAGGPVTLDGNSVDLNQEKPLAAENALDYEAAVTFATHTVNLLMTAIKGAAASSSSSGGS